MLNSLIFDENPHVFTKFYCSCGRFVDIDTKAVRLKKSLHKDVECAQCRNARIARELGLNDESEDLENGVIYF